MLTIAVICLLSGASAPARAAEFQVAADSLTAVNQVNASSVVYFGAKSSVGNPDTATELTTPGGLYFDGTFYRAWNRQTNVWVYLATAGVAGAGLNADYLDGLDSSAFGDATAANQTTILSRIGTSADAASATPSTLFSAEKYLISKVQSVYVAAITMTGIGSAPACPGGWLEIVAQTAAGSFQPVTGATATSQASGSNINTGATYTPTWLSSVSTTDYTLFYRVCGLPR